MDSKVLRSAATALAALDFADDVARIETIEAEIARLESAIATGEARLAALATGKASGSIDANGVADLLLAGTDAITAAATAPSAEARDSERSALMAGLGALRRRVTDAEHEIKGARNVANGKAARALAPLVGALMDDMRRNAETLVEGFAAIHALAVGLQTFQNEDVAASKAAGSVMSALGTYRREISVPREIADLLDSLPRNRALRVTRIRSVQGP